MDQIAFTSIEISIMALFITIVGWVVVSFFQKRNQKISLEKQWRVNQAEELATWVKDLTGSFHLVMGSQMGRVVNQELVTQIGTKHELEIMVHSFYYDRIAYIIGGDMLLNALVNYKGTIRSLIEKTGDQPMVAEDARKLEEDFDRLMNEISSVYYGRWATVKRKMITGLKRRIQKGWEK